jgi:hypothetical protein
MNILLLSPLTEKNIFYQKVAASHQCTHLFVQSSNPAAISIGTTVSINVFDFFEVEAFCEAHKIGLVIINELELLKNGLYDFLNSEKRTWKGVVTGCSKKLFDLVNPFTIHLPVCIADGNQLFSIENKFADKKEVNRTALFLKENNIEVNGFITTHLHNLTPIIPNEDEVLYNLETDLVSIFVAAYNGTFEDINVEFID